MSMTTPIEAPAEITTKKVLAVIGTRPEAIKMTPVIRALAETDGIEVRTCVTGQHREMLDQMLRTFDLSPDHDLNVMVHGQSTTQITRSVMDGMEKVIRAERPDWVLVQGDTTTAMAAALAAFHEHVHVGHVEAGLRTGFLHSPFPEEGNRKLAAAISEVHFAPTAWAAENLYREGVGRDSVIVTGNTVIDALQATQRSPFDPAAAGLDGLLDDAHRHIVLVTAHRRENFGTPIERICHAVAAVADRHPEARFVCPVHLNPTVRAPFFRILAGRENVDLLPPLNYRAMVWALHSCSFVVTDSGGLQEEAAGLGKPVLVLRDSTERPEGVNAGVARLVGTRTETLEEAIEGLITDEGLYRRMASCPNPYGDGRAAERIATAIAAHRAQRVPEDALPPALEPAPVPDTIEFSAPVPVAAPIANPLTNDMRGR
jgi:UDP-N-acetylglucosamine 2-epimerase (non-hydrolysing)